MQTRRRRAGLVGLGACGASMPQCNLPRCSAAASRPSRGLDTAGAGGRGQIDTERGVAGGRWWAGGGAVHATAAERHGQNTHTERGQSLTSGLSARRRVLTGGVAAASAPQRSASRHAATAPHCAGISVATHRLPPPMLALTTHFPLTSLQRHSPPPPLACNTTRLRRHRASRAR